MVRAARRTVLAAIALSALIGLQHLTRGTAVEHVRGVGADASPVAPNEPEFSNTVAMLTGAMLLSGNDVQVALNGHGTYPRLWDDLRSAQQTITLQLYYGQPGRMADTLRQILLERASAGVHIFILYDAFGFQDLPADHRAALRAAGVILAPFRPFSLFTLHKVQNRSHVRGIVIDGRLGWTGGFGIADKWCGDGRTNGAWRETNVRFEGPAVRQLQAAFTEAWAEATGVLFSGRATTVHAETGGVRAGLLYARPTMGSTAAARFLALTIAGATKTLYITNGYFAPNDDFVKLLADADRRGVDVRILAPGPSTDVRTVRLAGRAQYDRLLASGVRIYEWQGSVLHAKTFVADGVWSTIGSMNFDNRSLALNDESTLMILDEQVGQQLTAVFLDDISHAEEITVHRFAGRPWTQRMLESAASLIARVL